MHAYFRRPYFSKFFGGKNEMFSTEVAASTMIFLKKRRMRI